MKHHNWQGIPASDPNKDLNKQIYIYIFLLSVLGMTEQAWKGRVNLL